MLEDYFEEEEERKPQHK